jgi:hypothetical protein
MRVIASALQDLQQDDVADKDLVACGIDRFAQPAHDRRGQATQVGDPGGAVDDDHGC